MTDIAFEGSHFWEQIILDIYTPDQAWAAAATRVIPSIQHCLPHRKAYTSATTPTPTRRYAAAQLPSKPAPTCRQKMSG